MYFPFYSSTIEKILIPQSVEYIGEYTFENCNNLTNIVILNENIVIEPNASYYIDIIDNEERKISVSKCPDEKPYLLTIDTPY